MRYGDHSHSFQAGVVSSLQSVVLAALPGSSSLAIVSFENIRRTFKHYKSFQSYGDADGGGGGSDGTCTDMLRPFIVSL